MNIDKEKSINYEIKQEIIKVLKKHMSSNKKIAKKPHNKSVNIIKPLILAIFMVAMFSLIGCENQVATKRGVVSGLVLDTKGNRVVNAIVTSHRSLLSASTNEDGYYEFTSLDVGTQRLSVKKEGFYVASRTIDLGYGQSLSGINIKLEPLPEMITWKLFKREVNSAKLQINCAEPMSVVVIYREKHSMFIRTAADNVMKEHIITLKNLFENSDYLVSVEGTTADGRKFSTEETSFHTVPRLDLAGAPDMPTGLTIKQNTAGAEIVWKYSGIEPLKGFRIYKAESENDLSVLIDETQLFGNDTKFIDESVKPGQRYSYAIQSVDLDGNVSSLTSKIDFIPAGTLKDSVVWKKSWSPVSINGDIRVPKGKTLTIEPGTTVKFSEVDDSKSGFDPNVCEFIIEGTLIASATEAEQIKLISGSALPSKNDWKGIRIISEKDQPESVLQNLTVSGAEEGVSIYDSQVNISAITARYCKYGIALHGASATSILNLNVFDCTTGIFSENTWNCSLRYVTVRNAEDGIYQTGDSNFSLRNFDIRNVTDTGLKIEARTAPYVRSGVIRSDSTGFVIGGGSGDFQFMTIDAINAIVVDGASKPTLKNCILVNTQIPGTGIGINEKTLGRSYPYMNIYNFEFETENCNQNGSPIINANPHFIGGAGSDYDYHLKNDSPIKTTAENGSEPGAYGAVGI